MANEDEPSHLTSAQAADRRSRDDLRTMWSDLADQNATDTAAHLPTIIEEVARQIGSTTGEIGRLRHLITRLEAAAEPIGAMSDLLALLETTEVTLKRFRDELTASA